MHDLIRRYARHLVGAYPAARSSHALERLLDYYQHTATLAEARLARLTPASSAAASPGAHDTPVPDLTDLARALSWARDERVNLLACLDLVTRRAQLARIVTLTASMAALMRHDGPWTEALDRHAVASETANRLGDRPGQPNALSNLAALRLETGNLSSAMEVVAAALDIYRDIGDKGGEAEALN